MKPRKIGNYIVTQDTTQWMVKPLNEQYDFVKFFATIQEAIRFAEIMTEIDEDLKKIRRRGNGK